MRTETQIRVEGMQALILALGPVEAERFVAAVSRDRLNYTQWRREGLPKMTIDAIAQQANALTEQLNAGKHD